MNGADPLKHRLTLWLKSEQAMGLPSVPRVTFSEIPAENMSKSRQREQTPPPVRVTSPTASAPASKPAPAGSANTPLLLLDTPFDAPILPREEKIRLLQELDLNSVKGCVKCGLSKSRTQTVFGEGDPDAPILFI